MESIEREDSMKHTTRFPKLRFTFLALPMLAFCLNAAPVRAQVTKQGDGDDATYLLRKKYPEKCDAKIVIKRPDSTLEGTCTLEAAPKANDAGNTQSLKFTF